MRRAAQYVRMSTEHQRYSPQHQQATIAAYAALNGYQIVQTYQDEGASGLSLKGRAGLQSLLADVVSGAAEFEAVLVFDISRWGRFQNPDQGAHYEFLCAEAGVRVEYCAELFSNDGSLASTVLKSLKRVMAAEYSRELSAKVRAAKLGYARQGFWQQGRAPYGLRRRIVAPDGSLGQVLQAGERKAIQGHRSILTPGPSDEVLTVRRIFRLYCEVCATPQEICSILNEEANPSPSGGLWSPRDVRRIIRNPAYGGDLVFRRSRGGVDQARRIRPQEEWLCRPRAFEAIVPRRLVEKAQQRLAASVRPRKSEAWIKAAAREIIERDGQLTLAALKAWPGMPSFGSIYRRFGGIAGLAAEVGRGPGPRRYLRPSSMSDSEMLDRLMRLLVQEGRLSRELIDRDATLPHSSAYAARFGGVRGAYARIGYPVLSLKERASPIARARIAGAVERAKVALARAGGAQTEAAPEGGGAEPLGDGRS